jgi:hypothetical protein
VATAFSLDLIVLIPLTNDRGAIGDRDVSGASIAQPGAPYLPKAVAALSRRYPEETIARRRI